MILDLVRPAIMIARCLTALALFCTTPLISEEQTLDLAPLNEQLTQAFDSGEEWAQDPALIAPMLVGNWIVPGNEMASMRREVASSTSGEDPTTGITVVVKEDGLLDDAVRRIDHSFIFNLQDGKWVITEASVKYHNARPAFPLREEENMAKATAGALLLRQAPSPALAEIAKTAGILDLPETTTLALGGDPDSLNALLNLSLDLTEESREDYARLLYGLSCSFEKNGFSRYLFFNLEEEAPMKILEMIRELEEGEI